MFRAATIKINLQRLRHFYIVAEGRYSKQRKSTNVAEETLEANTVKRVISLKKWFKCWCSDALSTLRNCQTKNALA